MAQSLASVADPPLPKMMSLPPRSQPLVNRQRRSRRCAPPRSRATCARRAASSSTFIRIDDGDLAHEVGRRLLLASQERIEKSRLADLVAQLAMLEEDVHRLPERVVQDLDDLLVHERIRSGGRDRVGCPPRRAGRTSSRRESARGRERSDLTSSPSGGPKPMTMSSGRTSVSSQGPNSTLRSSAGSARLPTITGWTNSTETCWASVA